MRSHMRSIVFALPFLAMGLHTGLAAPLGRAHPGSAMGTHAEHLPPTVPTAPAGGPSSTVEGENKKHHNAESQRVIMQQTGDRVVTGSFLRMQEPHVLVELAKRVAAGKADQTELENLAGKSFGQTLMKADWTSSTALKTLKPRISTNDPVAPQSHFWTDVHNLVAEHYTQLPGDMFGPQSVNFGDTMLNEVHRFAFHVISPTDAHVTASLQTNSGKEVKVVGMTTWLGVWTKAPGKTSLYPIPDQHVNGAGPIDISAGQELTVDVMVQSDHNELVDSQLVVTGSSGLDAWTAQSSIFASIHAGGITVIGTPKSADLATIQGQGIDAVVALRNVASHDLTTTLSASALPEGVTMKPVTLVVPASAEMQTTLHFDVAANATETIGSSVPIAINCKDGYPDTTAFTMSVFEPIHEFMFDRMDAGQVDLSAPVIGVQSNGAWYFNAGATDSANLWGDTALIGFKVSDHRSNHGAWLTQDFSPGQTTSVNFTGTDKWISDNYTSIAGGGAQVFMQVDPKRLTAGDLFGQVEQIAGVIIPLAL